MITIEQAKNLKPGDTVYFTQMYKTDGTMLDAAGCVRAVRAPIPGDKVRKFKVNGTPKIWKTRPNDVKVPIKYGMYEYGYLGTVDNCEPLERFFLTEAEAAETL